MTGHVLDALNQPLVVFLLLVGTGGLVIVGELQTMAREIRRKAGEGDATGRAAFAGSPGLGRRYRLTLLAAAVLLLVSAFGTTSASFSSQLSGGLQVDVVFPTITPATAPTTAPTDALTPGPTRTLTPGPTRTLTPRPTRTLTPGPTRTLTPAPPTDTPPTDTPPTDTPAPPPTDTPAPQPTDTPAPPPTDTPAPPPTDTPPPV